MLDTGLEGCIFKSSERETDMTTEQTKRTVQALAETLDLLDKELSYLPHLQKADRIEWLPR